MTWLPLPPVIRTLGLLCIATAFSAEARFCTKVETVGRITKGDHRSVNRKDGHIVQVESVRTDSRMVQRADLTLTFTIPEAVSLVDVAAMHVVVTSQGSTNRVTTIMEVWNHVTRTWQPFDTLRIGIDRTDTDFGIQHAAHFIESSTRLFKLRLRTKNETTRPYYLKIDAVNLIGIRPEGLKDYGDLFAVTSDPVASSSYQAKLKKLKDDWDLSFNKGGRLIPIKDWETTEERKEKLKKDWRRSWNKNGRVITFEQQMRRLARRPFVKARHSATTGSLSCARAGSHWTASATIPVRSTT
jgi:hypothetical protein